MLPNLVQARNFDMTLSPVINRYYHRETVKLLVFLSGDIMEMKQ